MFALVYAMCVAMIAIVIDFLMRSLKMPPIGVNCGWEVASKVVATPY